MTDTLNRKAFEKWASKKEGADFVLHEDGGYERHDMHVAWEAWQAAWYSKIPSPPEGYDTWQDVLDENRKYEELLQKQMKRECGEIPNDAPKSVWMIRLEDDWAMDDHPSPNHESVQYFIRSEIPSGTLVEEIDGLRQSYGLMTHERIALNKAYDIVVKRHHNELPALDEEAISKIADTIWRRTLAGMPGISRADIARLVKESLPEREVVEGPYGYEIPKCGGTIYVGPMHADRQKVDSIICTIDYEDSYTDKAKVERQENAARICEGLNNGYRADATIARLEEGLKPQGWVHSKVAKAARLGFDTAIHAAIAVIKEEFTAKGAASSPTKQK